jgi:hypothetical protein
MRFRHVRPIAGLLAVAVLAPLAGCGGPTINAQSPPGGQPVQTTPSPRMRQPMPPQRQGMSTKQKVMLLAGAAAVYYLWKKHQNKTAEGPDGKYYLSKNGRVYYRDLKTGAYQWVDPPRQPIAVTPDEYQQYMGQPAPEYGGTIRQAPAGWPGNQAYASYR